jgi:SAM-dependent methyltransferase
VAEDKDPEERLAGPGMLRAPGGSRRLARVLDAAFGHPRGTLGRLGAAVMARGNAAEERRAVTEAALRPGEQVLVVGHGPGVGVQAAAAAVTPGGRVTGVEPSPLMTRIAGRRCADLVGSGAVELREGSAESTGCPAASMDAVLSVNNVMLWDLPAGFAEVRRVLRPGGRLVLSVHRHVLDLPAARLAEEASRAGLVSLELAERPRRRIGPAVDLVARAPHT